MSTKKSINKQQIFIEFLSVVFAVILALILNNWRESLTTKTNLKSVEAAIKKEVLKNDSLITQSYLYRDSLLQKFYNNQHLISAIPVSDFTINVNDNKALADFFRTSLLFGQREYYQKVIIEQEGNMRVLILDENVFDIKIEADTFKLMGLRNVRLKIPDLSNNSLELAQATATITEMDVKLVESLNVVHSLIDTYEKTCETALQMVYTNSQNGLIPVIEDMFNLESKLIKANAQLLKELQN